MLVSNHLEDQVYQQDQSLQVLLVALQKVKQQLAVWLYLQESPLKLVRQTRLQ